MGHDEQAVVRGVADGNEATLAGGMVRVVKGGRKRIVEDGYSLVKRDRMLTTIPLCLDTVPLKVHSLDRQSERRLNVELYGAPQRGASIPEADCGASARTPC